MSRSWSSLSTTTETHSKKLVGNIRGLIANHALDEGPIRPKHVEVKPLDIGQGRLSVQLPAKKKDRGCLATPSSSPCAITPSLSPVQAAVAIKVQGAKRKMKQGGGLFNKRAKEELTLVGTQEDADLAMEAMDGLLGGAKDIRSAIQGQDPNTLCLLTKANLQSMTLAEREKQYKTKAIPSRFGMIPGLREKYEGKQTKFETLAHDENDERKVAIRLLTVVDNKDDGRANGFFDWNS